MKERIYLPLLVVISFILTGCQLVAREQPNPTDTVFLPLSFDTETPQVQIEEAEPTSTEMNIPPTEIPTETLTPSPTETLAPTETQTPDYTATETVPATPDPEEGIGDILFDERFDGGSGWGWTYVEEGVVSFGFDSSGVLAVFKDTNQGWRISLGPDKYSVGDQRAQLTANAQTCGEQDEWGFLYRGSFTEDNKFNGYIFKINCAGQIQVLVLEENQSRVLLGWTAVEGLETGDGAENTLMVWAFGEEMRFYANGTYVETVIDSTYEFGEYGIYAQDKTDGNAEILFTRLRVNDVQVD